MGSLIGGDQCTEVFVVAKCWMGCFGQYSMFSRYLCLAPVGGLRAEVEP